MPLELQVIRAEEFVRLGAEHHLNFEASKDALRVLARACWKRGLNRALLDLRALPVPPKPVFTPSQLSALVETFHEAGLTKRHRLAVLYRVDAHGGARLFAFISRREGWQVEAFPDFEAALMWLSAPDNPRPESTGDTVPIRQKKPRTAAAAAKETAVPIRQVRGGRHDRT